MLFPRRKCTHADRRTRSRSGLALVANSMVIPAARRGSAVHPAGHPIGPARRLSAGTRSCTPGWEFRHTYRRFSDTAEAPILLARCSTLVEPREKCTQRNFIRTPWDLLSSACCNVVHLLQNLTIRMASAISFYRRRRRPSSLFGEISLRIHLRSQLWLVLRGPDLPSSGDNEWHIQGTLQ